MYVFVPGWAITSCRQQRSYTRASELNLNFNLLIIKINKNYSACNSRTCQVCLFDMAFQKQSKGRQRTIFDCLNVNQSDSSASKQQPSDETDEQEMQLVSNDIRTTSVCTSVTAVLGGVPDNIAVSPEQVPVQPGNIVFPVTYFSSKGRSFNPAWFRSYRWLEYSVKLDACFCYPCRLFGSNGGGSSSRPVQVFTMTGFKNWKHATGKSGSLAVHDTCSSHRQAVVAWDMYNVTAKSGVTVADQLGSARAEKVRNNRHYIKTIAEVLLLCAKQDIALRGHRESAESPNRGNVLEILMLIANHDNIVSQRFHGNPRNAMYVSPDIQNALLNDMGNIIHKKIVSAVQDATYFSILADETKDLSKQEQMAIVIRYVDVQSCTLLTSKPNLLMLPACPLIFWVHCMKMD